VKTNNSPTASAPAAPIADAADNDADVPTILPLSAYTNLQSDEPPFRPAFEVDKFIWSARCQEVIAATTAGLDALARQLLADNLSDSKVLAVTGCGRGEGRTTFLLALARRLAGAGSRVAVVDADFGNGQLARQLGLSVRVGLEDVLLGDLSVEEVLVESLEDRIALLPLRSPAAGQGSPDKLRLAVALGILREKYDAVLVDAGPSADAPRESVLAQGTGVAAALVIRDARNTTDAQLDQAHAHLDAAGIELLGIIETFAREAVA
jgi:Mrp family chromosome partitioning ATPase